MKKAKCQHPSRREVSCLAPRAASLTQWQRLQKEEVNEGRARAGGALHPWGGALRTQTFREDSTGVQDGKANSLGAQGGGARTVHLLVPSRDVPIDSRGALVFLSHLLQRDRARPQPVLLPLQVSHHVAGARQTLPAPEPRSSSVRPSRTRSRASF